MKGKQFIIGFILGALLFSSVSTLAATKIIEANYNNIKIQVNGKEVKTDVEPFVMDGRTMVPVRFIAEEFGKEVNFDENTSTVKINDKSAEQSGNDKSDKVYPVATPNPILGNATTYDKDGLTIYQYKGEEYVLFRDVLNKYSSIGFHFDTNDGIVWDLTSSTTPNYPVGSFKPLLKNIEIVNINDRAFFKYSYYLNTLLPYYQGGK